MARKYSLSDAAGRADALANQAEMLEAQATKVQSFFQTKFGDKKDVHDKILWQGPVVTGKNGFLLRTPYGEVRADFSLARASGNLVGKCTFCRTSLLPSRDHTGEKVYAFVFTHRGVASFDETLSEEWSFASATAGASDEYAYDIALELLGHLAAAVSE